MGVNGPVLLIWLQSCKHVRAGENVYLFIHNTSSTIDITVGEAYYKGDEHGRIKFEISANKCTSKRNRIQEKQIR